MKTNAYLRQKSDVSSHLPTALYTNDLCPIQPPTLRHEILEKEDAFLLQSLEWHEQRLLDLTQMCAVLGYMTTFASATPQEFGKRKESCDERHDRF